MCSGDDDTEYAHPYIWPGNQENYLQITRQTSLHPLPQLVTAFYVKGAIARAKATLASTPLRLQHWQQLIKTSLTLQKDVSWAVFP